MKEVCICSAVRAKDGYIYRGQRHADALIGLQRMPAYKNERPHGDDQGFITSHNRYVTRSEAYEIQKKAGIESVCPSGSYLHGECYSEDLY